MFAAGDFQIPMLVHGRVPPGVDVMKRFKEQIRYSFENIPDGGRVRIRTENPEALSAIHNFLRFQIADHHTRD